MSSYAMLFGLSGARYDAVEKVLYVKPSISGDFRCFFSSGKKDFTCHKRLRSISGNVVGVVWINEWTDAGTGKRMNSKGVEFWTMSGERIARWDAATAVWEAGSL